MLVDGVMRLASSGGNLRRHAVWPSKFEAPVRGIYQIRVAAFAYGTDDADGTLRAQGITPPANGRDVLKDLSVGPRPVTHTFRAELQAGENVSFRYTDSVFDYDDKFELRGFLFDLFRREPRLAAAWDRRGDVARGGSGWRQLLDAMAVPNLDVASWTGDGTEVSEQIDRLAKRLSVKSVNTGEMLVYRYFDEGPGIAITDVRIEGPLRVLESDRRRDSRQRQLAFLGKTLDDIDATSIDAEVASVLDRMYRRPATQTEVQTYTDLVSDRSVCVDRLAGRGDAFVDPQPDDHSQLRLRRTSGAEQRGGP